MAWSDKDWILEGAAVNVSIVCFDSGAEGTKTVDGLGVSKINSDLTTETDLTSAKPLRENCLPIWSIGTQKGGAFEFDFKTARDMLKKPNPTGRSNTEVVRPWMNASDLTGRPRGLWGVDFGPHMVIAEAASFEAPFEYIRKHVKPERDSNRRDSYRLKWWIHQEPRAELRNVISAPTVLLTPRIAKHRIWTRQTNSVLADCALVVFSRVDYYFLGVLQSSLHELWALDQGTQLEDRPRYTPTSTFETFPLPWPPGKEPTTRPTYLRISAAAKELNDLRERWLNPPELLDPLAKILDAQDDFSDVPPEARPLLRHSALMAIAAASPNLKKRTLTNLYNERPTWLKLAHEKLDRAVLAAYAAIDPDGHWQEDWATLYTDTGAGTPLPPTHPLSAERLATDQKILTNLLRLNHLRATS